MCNLSVGIREEGKLEEMINSVRNMIECFFMLHVQKEECIQIVTEKYPSIEKEKVIAMTNQFYG
ncbi:MAG: hypothetical protein KBT48_08245 [Firmicutes bacterium]|nr:hypothetical protein [Bacillota bacterium]